MLGITPSLDIGRPANLTAPLNRGLVSWWMAINQGPFYGGARFFDLLGKNHGTLTNGPTWIGGGRPGGFGALNFDGTNDEVDVGSPASLTNLNPLTVSAWINLGSFVGNIFYFVSKFVSSGWAFGIDGNFTNTHKPILFDGSTVLYANTAITLNVWQHVGFTVSGTATTFYLNGQPDGSGTNSLPSDSGFGLTIGRRTDGGGVGFLGPMDDVRVYNRALSASDFAQLYAASRTGYRNELNWINRSYAAPAAASTFTWQQLTDVGCGEPLTPNHYAIAY